MTYYRIAAKTKQSPTQRWVTTKLTSLQAVLIYLQTYRCPAHTHQRVFCASSMEVLDEMLALESRGDVSFSVPAEQVVSGQQTKRLEEEQATAEALLPARQRALTTTPSANAATEPDAPAMPLLAGRITALEARRLELELGAGGDHDMPYTFAFPRALPETRAWIRLMEHVQRGDLVP
jgi:hypothetical protein